MATSKINQNSSDFEEYIRDLLECPVCMDTIKSVPVYQCTNGHVICKDCIEKLNNCPICRNDSALVRILKLENIVQRLEGIQPENKEPTTPKPNIKKWGKGSVRGYGTITEPNQVSSVELNLQANPEPFNPPANHQENLGAEQTGAEFLKAVIVMILIIGFVVGLKYLLEYLFPEPGK